MRWWLACAFVLVAQAFDDDDFGDEDFGADGYDGDDYDPGMYDESEGSGEGEPSGGDDDYAILQLDNATLPLVTSVADVFVKIDSETANSGGEQVFKELKTIILERKTPLLLGTVAVGTWGERENADIAVLHAGLAAGLRHTVEDEDLEALDLPVYVLFPRSRPAIPFSGDKTSEDIKEFLSDKVGADFGPRGTVRALAELARTYAKAKTPAERIAASEKASAVAKDLKEPARSDSAYYLKVMEKAKDKEGWIAAELARLEDLFDHSAVAEQKRESFERRMNVLKAFLGGNSDEVEEL
jgi:hypothetical protein